MIACWFLQDQFADFVVFAATHESKIIFDRRFLGSRLSLADKPHEAVEEAQQAERVRCSGKIFPELWLYTEHRDSIETENRSINPIMLRLPPAIG